MTAKTKFTGVASDPSGSGCAPDAEAAGGKLLSGPFAHKVALAHIVFGFFLKRKAFFQSLG